MSNKRLILASLALVGLTASGQQYQSGYVDWGTSSERFYQTLNDWEVGKQITEDDNFFISRVKPKLHFRNLNTQVNQKITENVDKRLIAWIPINGIAVNALPDGVFDSEVFNMWPYVTHYGNWTAPLGRVPGNFLDVAHKNGVAVSSVASIPWGSIFGGTWETALDEMTQAGAEKTAQLLYYYGVDGLGYNSEFSTGAWLLDQLHEYHQKLVQIMKPKNPLFENMWYDGTNDNGQCTFDRGLGGHNVTNFGKKGEERSSLFFNYNWNNMTLLNGSVDYAKNIERDPLYLYAGVNMQGGEPTYNNWPLLAQVPISIGLWGAHSENMFWESRGELGSAPEAKQRAYQLRTEKWFGGSNRNPVITPEIISSMTYSANSTDFHGMASMMSARSSLKWNLSEEPFITYFNLGNGKYFNWMGKRQHDKEWYNIGAQDYLPTWRWWFTNKLLGRSATDVVKGLDAEFTWDDAYVGGSTVRIHGTSANEYLHLFKTEFALQKGDVITVRYKLAQGAANMNLVLTAKGAESVAINENEFNLLTTTDEADEDIWVTRQFTVGDELAGKDLALIALHFENAKDMNLYLGEFSIVRGTTATPAAPEITKWEQLANNKFGVDAKIIFNMKNDKPAGEPCYNLDVNTSLFKIYAQQEGCEQVLMGVTTSWASLIYSVPVDLKAASKKMRYGVSALSVDMKSESPITWTDYAEPPAYVYDDNVQTNKKMIKPGEAFEMSYVDPRHTEGTWVLTDESGTEVFRGTGHSVSVSEGLANIGSYDLQLTGQEIVNGEAKETTRTFSSFVQITKLEVGALPEIQTLTANDKEADLEVKAGDEIALAYTGRSADGSGSQGIDLKELPFGTNYYALGLTAKQSFSVTFWLKFNKLAEGTTQLLSVCDRGEGWPKNNWGWIWSNVDQTGAIANFTFRGTDWTNNKELKYHFANSKLPIGNWVHVAYVFDYNAAGDFKAELYLNGVKQTVTGWERTNGSLNTTEPGYESDVYGITDGMMVAVGGAAHGRNGIDGVVDNLMIWNKAITADEVKYAMGDVNKDNLPAEVQASWDVDTKADDAKQFLADGVKAGAKAGSYTYASGEGEGQGFVEWTAPEYTSGCPFIVGSAFPVVTTPNWKAKKGIVTDITGNDKEGTAKLTFAKGGDYAVTLTLSNSLGSDSRTFQVIKVEGTPDGIEDAAAAELKAYTVGSEMFVEFAEAGNYDVRVYNAAGQQVAAKAAALAAGSKMQLTLHQAGTYVLAVKKDGQTVRTVKLIRK